MDAHEEINLLIKSRYPLIFVESADESYVINHLTRSAEELGLMLFQWSVTDGLCRGDSGQSMYQSQQPALMLKLLLQMVQVGEKNTLFVLKDFSRLLTDAITLRLFKDVLAVVEGTKSTIVIVAPAYDLPKELEPMAGRITGLCPDMDEIKTAVKDTVDQLTRKHDEITVNISDDDMAVIVESLRGLTLGQIRSALTQCVLDDRALTAADIAFIGQYKKKYFDTDGLLEYYPPEKGEIANFTNLKTWLGERKNSFNSNGGGALKQAPKHPLNIGTLMNEEPAPVRRRPLPPPRGVLLMGVQGCGKSLAVKVIARELNLPLYRFDLGKIFSKYIGETEQNLLRMLAVVEKLAPLCLWIDEIEKCFSTSSGDVDGGVSKRVLGSFLTWMQEHRLKCFLAATANDVMSLPPEFLRKGRFDEVFFVDLPDDRMRRDIYAIHLLKHGLTPETFDLPRLSGLAADFNGAEIEQSIIAALYRADSQGEQVTTDHIAGQITATKPLAVIKAEQIADLRAWAAGRTVPA